MLLTDAELEGMIQDTGGSRFVSGELESWCHDEIEDEAQIQGGFATGVMGATRALLVVTGMVPESKVSEGSKVEVQRHGSTDWEYLVVQDHRLVEDGRMRRLNVRQNPDHE